MKPTCLLAAGLVLGLAGAAMAHDPSSDGTHPAHRTGAGAMSDSFAPAWFLARAETPPGRPAPRAGASASRPAQAASFDAFAPRVAVRWDEQYLYVEGRGLPGHGMMTGITAWQQQVPLPQDYTGDNAWRIPRVPVPSPSPVSIRGRFLRGAIAVAANGIPIFNPQNNRGEVSADIGELDRWGGHCGRADDYHYHAAPLHLQEVLGNALPIAHALDGYPVYGLVEPDGSEPRGLDGFNGHETAALGYHYHASRRYPFVNGGFHGVVVEREGQVDPQPRAQPVRPALPALRGAVITGFKGAPDGSSLSLQYAVGGRTSLVDVVGESGGAWRFRFTGPDGATREEVHRAGGGPGGREPGAGRRPGGGQGGRRGNDAGAPPDAGNGGEGRRGTAAEIRMPRASFVLGSPAFKDGGELPARFTGAGAGSSPPLEWSGAPEGTRSFALAMHHVDREGRTKHYWILHGIPAGTTALPADAHGIGVAGRNGIDGRVGYAPPNSKGPGAKSYAITLYALSAIPAIPGPASGVGRDELLDAIRGSVLATAELRVVHTSAGNDRPAGPGRNAGGGGGQVSAAGSVPRARPEGGMARVVKPALSDTVRVNVYADNWFALYINGKLRAVDPIEFLPHNVVSVDILPEYPMTIAVLAKDNADPRTGLEYGDHIGDGGFIIRFADGTVSDATWKAKAFMRGPVGRDVRNPRVDSTPLPAGWEGVDFDDRDWPAAVEYPVERVGPKEAFHAEDFAGAKFIWSADLDLDNTVVFRTRVERPGWKPRWTARPDLRVGANPGVEP